MVAKLSDELALEALQAVEKNKGNITAAAAELGVPRTTLDARYRTAVMRSAITGVEEPFVVKGVSQYYGKDGLPGGRWVKTNVDAEKRAEMMRALIQRRVDAIPPRPPAPESFVEKPSEDLCNLLTITDAHVGALCWHREGGDDWDLKIAQETLERVFIGMIHAMPAADTLVINQLGDFLHTDGMKPLTPGHGHVLDADSRYPKMSEVAVDILENIIVAGLAKHRRVHILMAEGNHDESSSVWLRLYFKRIFRNEPRVTVEDSPLPYYAFEHGQVMLAFHHGHKLKPRELPGFFAAQFPEMWGRTKRRYSHNGHWHHLDEKDERGMRTLQHPTIAANDAHGSRGGWISPREAIGITYSREKEESRIFATPGMFQG